MSPGRRGASEQLVEREERLYAFARASREACISTDAAGRITYLNPAAEELFGCPCDSAVAADAGALLATRLGTRCRAAFERFRADAPSPNGPSPKMAAQAITTDEMSAELSFDAFDHAGGRFFTIVVHAVCGHGERERERVHYDSQLAEAQELARLGTFELDVATGVVHCSPELYRIYGVRPEELEPTWETFLERVHPEHVGRVRADVTRALRGDRAVSTLHCIVREDGEVRELHTRMKVVDDGGTFGGARVIGMCQDVTEQRREAEERREARERFRLAFENAPIGMALTAPDGRWLQVNRALCEITGYSEAELLAGTSQAITHPDDLGRAVESARRLLRGEGRFCRFEMRYMHSQGHPVEVKLSMSIVRDVKGEPRYFIAQVEDITERRQTTDALRESRERLQAIIDNTRAGLYLKDLDGRYLLANAEFAAICGRKPEELAGKTDRELFSAEVAERFASHDRKVLELQAPLEVEESLPNADGERTYISQRFPLRDRHGLPYAMGGISTDITARVRVEAENRRLEAELHRTQRLEMVGRLAGRIAHDFNNLVAVMLNYASLLEEDLAGRDEQVEQAGEIRRAAEHAAALTQRLVAFSSGEVIEPQVLLLNDVVAGANQLLAMTIGPTVELTMELSRNPWPIEADPDQLRRVLINLAVNARDAMPGGGSLLISTENVVVGAERASRLPEGIEPGRYVCLSVGDTGCGMAQDVAARVFEPFFTTKGPKQGRGLGLATVYGVVRQAGGRVELETEPGSGTTVRVYLPATDRAPAARPPEQRPSEPRTGHGQTILVVEDDDSVRALVSRILERGHYRVLEASGADEAMRALEDQAEGVALLVCDVAMPKLSGTELARRLAASHPRLKVLFMSGYTEDVVAAGMSDPATPLLKKPFTVAGLLGSVERALGSPVERAPA